jgi:nicotinate-nucleotide--dimethylbenzimidazole phosphoribosyltransferase
MNLLAKTRAAITDVNHGAAAATQRLLDAKTKPRRSLGQLEDLACQLAAIQGTPNPPMPTKAVVVMAADHGVAEEGVSAYPPEVTWQMLLNFACGGAAINVLARHADARLVVVDMGVSGPAESVPGVTSCRIALGTRNFTKEPAMTLAQAIEALERGISLVDELAASRVDLIAIGEMGIGNTTAATALVAALTALPVEKLVGRGTGIDDVTLQRKTTAIKNALVLHSPNNKSPEEVLACLGGFEIAGLAGVVLGSAARGIPVVLDGFIAGTAALVAARLQPLAAKYVIASHESVEIGHKVVLEALGTRPLFRLDMRLGEGSGAALALPLIDAAVRILHEMATFDSAGVSDSGK